MSTRSAFFIECVDDDGDVHEVQDEASTTNGSECAEGSGVDHGCVGDDPEEESSVEDKGMRVLGYVEDSAGCSGGVCIGVLGLVEVAARHVGFGDAMDASNSHEQHKNGTQDQDEGSRSHSSYMDISCGTCDGGSYFEGNGADGGATVCEHGFDVQDLLLEKR